MFNAIDDNEGIIFSTRNTSSCSAASGANTSLHYEADGRILFLFRDNNNVENWVRTDESFGCGWHLVVIKREGRNFTLYVDDVVKSTTISSDIDLTTTGDLFIGKSMYCSGTHFKGAIDEFKIYNTALNSSAVQQLRNQYGWDSNSSNKNIAVGCLGAQAFDNGSFNHWNAGLQGSWYAIDEDQVSYWAGLQGNSPQQMWITFDQTYSISRITIAERYNAYVLNGTVEYYDGTSWNELFTINKSSYDLTEDFAPIDAAGVRLTVNTLTAPSSWYNKVALIQSFEVYKAN